MSHWTLDDIPWERFEPQKLDPELLRIVKAASLVEQNGADYARYLCGVFADDAAFQDAAQRWGQEEIQHGLALGRYAQLADPSFDHEAACARFTAGYRVDLAATASVRGSRAGELVARCIVETGTSSYYTALAEATDEPVLKAICQRIAADELRHYKLFLTHLRRYLEAEGLGTWGRIKIALGRIRESEDDELAFAYHAANDPAGAYDRKRAIRAYIRRAYGVYRRHHIERGIAMVLKAAGLTPNGRVNRVATDLAWWGMRKRIAHLTRDAA
ncbi:MAG TPA: ferritin-like domain-containing protein [Stellaceae bacterium]|jgi:rubrerythrin|nr:ferritin-like domain-containing protein [Stellaceae bacterium]